MKKIISAKWTAVMIAVALILTCFASTLPVDAASTPDMKKANVKWDLKNNKTIKYKTAWSVIGTKTHKVKMTNYKVRNAKKKGYKQCTFTLTINRSIKPTKSQIDDMVDLCEPDALEHSENGPFGGNFWYAVVDYKTGKSLEGKNSKKVKVKDSDWKYSKKTKLKGHDGKYIWYYKRATTNVTITYPKKYKNLAIGFGGYTLAPKEVVYSSEPDYEIGGPDDPLAGTGIGVASYAAGYENMFKLTKFWKGKKAFSQETTLYSKTDKAFAHFKRVK